jgi:hypothetical protein
VFPGAGATADVAKTDIRLAYADDVLSGSPTWTYKKVNDDTNAAKSQFHGWVSVDPSTGFLYFTWYDTRNSGTANNTAQRYATVSTDGGATIRPNVRISDGTSNESSSNSNRDRSNYGDFNVHAAFGGVLNALWADNSMQQSNDLFFDRPFLTAQQVTGTGGAGDDTYYVRLDPSGTFVQIYENSAEGTGTPAFTLLKTAMSGLFLQPGAGNNTVSIDYTNGDPLPASGLDLVGTGGQTKLVVVGKAAADTIKLAGPATRLAAAAGADAAALSIQLAADTALSIDTSMRLASLTLGAAAVANLPPAPSGGPNVLVLKKLIADETARLDLTNNALVIDYDTATELPAVQRLVTKGYNAPGPRWGGTGITSSSAASDPGAAVGYAEASDVLSSTGGSFLGQNVDGTAALVRYTRSADADLNGTVDNADFARLYGHYGQSPATWSQGDFDYDANVTFADFQRLELNFGTGVGSPVSAAEAAAPLKSVPRVFGKVAIRPAKRPVRRANG